MEPSPEIGADALKWKSLIEILTKEPPSHDIRNDQLNNVFKAFNENLDRVKYMLVTHDLVGEMRAMLQNAANEAIFRVTGSFNSNIIGHPKLDDITRLIIELFKDNINKLSVKTGNADVDKIIGDAIGRGILERGSNMTIILQYSPEMRSALHSILASAITGVWTAFETMAGDLWEAALNAHPDCLANLNGRYRCKRPNNNADVFKKRLSDDSKHIKLDVIAKARWKTDIVMGTILRERYSFTTLNGIRMAYGEAFSKDSKEIDEIVCHETLDALSALRNVIVHKSIVADSEYVAKASYITGLPDTKIGEKINIDGEIVANLISGTMELGTSLLESVDKWIAKN